MILGLRRKKPEARALLDPTPRSAVEWIIANNEIPLTPGHLGQFETPEGKVAIIDPMIDEDADFIDVPTTGCDMVWFRNAEDKEDYRTSKFALVFGDQPVVSGKRCDWCSVDSVTIAPVTPGTLASLNQFQENIGRDQSLYTHFFEQFDCVDAPNARLPNGAHLPYVNAPDDGRYPVSELRSADGEVVAVFTDLMGRTEEYYDWLIPPNNSDI